MVARIAAAALLAKHWPDSLRHKGELALAGALANGGMAEEDAVEFVLLAYQSVPTYDSSALHRVEASVRDTYHKHETESEHTGFKTLCEAVGDKVAAAAMDWLGLKGAQSLRGTRSTLASAGLLDMIDGKLELFTAKDGRAYVSYTAANGVRETATLQSDEFRLFLTGLYFKAEGVPIANERVKEVIAALQSVAAENKTQRSVYTRTGASEDGSKIYYDIGDGKNVIEITADGWQVVAANAVDVRFRRPGAMQANVLPRRSEDARERFRALVNVEDDAGFVLLLSWLVQCFRPDGPYPILGVSSIQGSGKSTLTKMLRRIVDPNGAPLRSPQQSERDLAAAAINNYMVVVDNVSGIKPWYADCLCRLATGGGFASRTLYANEAETAMEACRPIVLNGIEDFASRGDIVDRMVPVSLAAIPADRRRHENGAGGIWQEFDALLPGLLAWLFDAVAEGLRKLPTVKLRWTPRMADFALFAVACEAALGFAPNTFLPAYGEAKHLAESELLDNSLVAQAILKALQAKDKPLPWRARPTALLQRLSVEMSDQDMRSYNWPRTARVLTNELKRITPALLAVEHIELEFVGANGGRIVSIAYAEGYDPTEAGIPPPRCLAW